MEDEESVVWLHVSKDFSRNQLSIVFNLNTESHLLRLEPVGGDVSTQCDYKCDIAEFESLGKWITSQFKDDK